MIEVVPENDDEGSWLASTIRFMAREVSALKPGAETVVTRLADILVVQAIRTWLGSAGPEERGYLASPASIRGSGERCCSCTSTRSAAFEPFSRQGGRDVALGVRCSLHRVGRKTGDGLPDRPPPPPGQACAP